MKKSTISLIAIILALTLPVCMFAGCGDQTSETAVSAMAEASVQAADEPVEPTEEVPVEGDPSVQVSTPEAETKVEEGSAAEEPVSTIVSEEPISLSYWCPIGPDMEGQINDFNDIISYQKAEELTNVHIDWIHVSQMAESDQFNLLIAGGDYPDMARNANTMYTGGFDAAVEEEILVDISPYLELAPNYSGYLEENETFKKAAYTDSGACVGFVSYSVTLANVDMGGLIRQDWLDELGLEAPATYDEYHDVALAFKDAYDLEDAIYLPSTLTGQKSNLAAGYGTPGLFTENNERVAPSHFYVVNDEVHLSFVEKGLKDYLTMIRDWLAEGLISKDFATRSGSVQDADNISNIAGGRTGIWYGEAQMMSDYIDMAENEDFKISAIPDAVVKEGEKVHFGPAENPYASGHTNCLFTTGNIEMSIKWCDFWFSEPGANLAMWGVEGLTYDYDENGAPYFTDFVLNNPDGYSSNNVISYNLASQVAAVSNGAVRQMAWEDYEVEASQLWTDTCDNAYMFPSVTLTADESTTYSALYIDAWTYAVENSLKFVMGDADIDADWDDYVQTLYDSFEVQKLIDLEQPAYERYQSR